TWMDELAEMSPLLTTSPMTTSVPEPLTVMALPGVPPQPAWLSAAMVGWYSRLLTWPAASAERRGEAPLVRMRANWRMRLRAPVIVNWLPLGPSELTTCVSVVPSP